MPRPIDVRYVDDPPLVPAPPGRRGEPHTRVWLRADGVLPDDPLVHVCALTFASDLTLLDSVLSTHGVAWVADVLGASLDHAMWFHRPFRADEWLLYESDSPSASGWPRLGHRPDLEPDGRRVASVVPGGCWSSAGPVTAGGGPRVRRPPPRPSDAGAPGEDSAAVSEAASRCDPWRRPGHGPRAGERRRAGPAD